MAEMVKATLNGEYEIILPKHRADREEWYQPQGWEKKRLRALRSRIRDYVVDDTVTPVIYYVGVEEGEMAALCQMWGGRIVMFEPNNLVWPNIKAIWEANNLEMPLITFSGFASNHNTVAPQILYGSFPQSADGEVIHNHGFKELVDPTDIPQIRIDTLVSITGLVPHIISLDVEGSEWEVLRGAEDILRNHHPDIFLSLHPEFLFSHYGEYSGDLRRWLREMAYNEQLLDYEHEVHLLYTKS